MHILFVGRFTGKKPKCWYFALYIMLLGVIEAFSLRFHVFSMLSLAVGVLVLYGMSRLAMGNTHATSGVAAVLAFYISQLSFGIINSAEAVLFPRLVGKMMVYLLFVAAMVLYFVICAGCYFAVRKLLSLGEGDQTPYIGLLLFPGLFFFAAELYILHTSYSSYAPSLELLEAGKHGALLFLQVMGMAALLCTLYSYHHFCRGFQARAALLSLTQAVQAQKTYIAEAWARYEQTKAFRHDIKNHLSVLGGLLGRGELEKSRAYLKKLEAASELLSFPYQTGNPVVDILLGEKLGLARKDQVEAEVSLLLPVPCGIEDPDLCVIFANALDNAINACRLSEGERLIRVTGRLQGDFYMLEFENTCPGGPLPLEGTGLANIRSAAEKYHGAVLAEKKGNRFLLNVLLDISGGR